MVDGASSREGRLEICNADEWGTVCDDSFSGTDANVVCRQLGFSEMGTDIIAKAVCLLQFIPPHTHTHNSLVYSI